MQNNDSEPYSINQITLDKIIHDKDNRFHLDNLYYSLDGQNIFKRIDRFRNDAMAVVDGFKNGEFKPEDYEKKLKEAGIF